jgi:uncharacterized protein (DUF1697 family)
MPTHVALLRGINVGGRNKVAMAALREVVQGLGHTEVATYIQSGNVVFTSEQGDTARLADALEAAIGERLGVRPKVVVLTRGELAQVVADNPSRTSPTLGTCTRCSGTGRSGPRSWPPWKPPRSE